MRDWRKLRAFDQAHALVLAVYRDSKCWPPEHKFGLTQQLLRSTLSVASNIVEGCSRGSQRDFYRFIEIAYGSACEAQYQLSVAVEFGFSVNVAKLEMDAGNVAKALNALLQSRNPKPEP